MNVDTVLFEDETILKEHRQSDDAEQTSRILVTNHRIIKLAESRFSSIATDQIEGIRYSRDEPSHPHRLKGIAVLAASMLGFVAVGHGPTEPIMAGTLLVFVLGLALALYKDNPQESLTVASSAHKLKYELDTEDELSEVALKIAEQHAHAFPVEDTSVKSD